MWTILGLYSLFLQIVKIVSHVATLRNKNIWKDQPKLFPSIVINDDNSGEYNAPVS